MSEFQKCDDDCRYFVKHYVNVHGYFKYIKNGHCSCNELAHNECVRRIQKALPCEFKEPREVFIEKRNEDIKDMLTSIRDRIDQFIQVIQEE